jgi:hypothetical protein
MHFEPGSTTNGSFSLVFDLPAGSLRGSGSLLFSLLARSSAGFLLLSEALLLGNWP